MSVSFSVSLWSLGKWAANLANYAYSSATSIQTRVVAWAFVTALLELLSRPFILCFQI